MSLPTVISLNKEIRYDFNRVEYTCPVTASAGLTTTGTSTNTGSSVVTGNLTVGGSVGVTGSVTAATLVANNTTTNALTTNGTATLNSTVNAGGILNSSGTLNTTGVLNMNGTMNVANVPVVSNSLSAVVGNATNIVPNGNGTLNWFRFGRSVIVSLLQPITSVTGGTPFLITYDISSMTPTTFQLMKGPCYYHKFDNTVIPFTGHVTVEAGSTVMQILGSVTGNQTAGFISGCIHLRIT